MIKIYSVLALLLLGYNFSLAQQQSYYWFNNQKITLNVDSTSITLNADEKSGTVEALLSFSKSQTGVKNAVSLRPDAVKVLLDPKNGGGTGLSRIKQVFPGVIVNYNFKYQGAEVLVLNRIVLKPRNGINEILSIFGKFISLKSSTQYGTYVFDVKDDFQVTNIANKIKESGLVEWCAPDFIAARTHNPLYPDQYYLNNTGQFGGTPGIDINAPEAWAITEGCGVRVAVVDEGVEDHEDLQGRVLAGFDPRNAWNPGNPLVAGDGHGVSVAGIIAASNNAIGIRGIAPNALIVPIRTFENGLGFTDSEIADGINWAWNQGQAWVINCSWGNPAPLNNVAAAIQNARTFGRVVGGIARGAIVVAASGNNNQTRNFIDFPAREPGVIAVGAIDRNGNIWGYSQRGPQLDLVAPSGNTNLTGDVRTTDRMNANGYEAGNYTNRFGGTSAAAPQVSGTVALMLSINPNLTEADVTTILTASATDMGPGGFDNTYGFGRLNAHAAVDHAIDINGPNSVCTTGTYSLGPGNFSATWSSNLPSVLSINNSGQATAHGNGVVTISATFTDGCGTTRTETRTVQVGPPFSGYFLVNGQPTSNATVCVNNFASIEVQPVDVTAWYSWSISNPGNAYLTNYNSPNTAFNAYTADCYSLTLQTSNACGTTQGYLTICAQDCFARYTIAPNPAKDVLNVAFEPTDNNAALPDEITLVSEQTLRPVRTVNVQELAKTTSFKQNQKVSFEVTELPRGVYYIQVKNPRRKGNELDVIRVLLE